MKVPASAGLPLASAILFPLSTNFSAAPRLNWWEIVAATAGLMTAVTLGAFSLGLMQRPSRVRRGIQLAPIVLDHDRANWGRAAVYRSPLLVRYRDPDGRLSESIIHPKNIQGEKAADRRIRPDTVNAFCEVRRDIHAFRYEGILWAADARTGEFIDDLYTYFGNAQAGGAPAPSYSPPSSSS